MNKELLSKIKEELPNFIVKEIVTKKVGNDTWTDLAFIPKFYGHTDSIVSICENADGTNLIMNYVPVKTFSHTTVEIIQTVSKIIEE